MRATPLVAVRHVVDGRARQVLLKLEGASRAGSVKERTARGLIGALEARGRLREGATLVESTSGNLGVALAALARERGYRLIAVVDPRAPRALRSRMAALGARVETVEDPDPHGGFLEARLD